MGAYETQGFKMDNTGRRIVVDPVTRIEGHMRCEVNLDSNNVIRNAVSTGTMWRGLEVILNSEVWDMRTLRLLRCGNEG